jgi:Phage integrase, N-terminal SAM-like domain
MRQRRLRQSGRAFVPSCGGPVRLDLAAYWSYRLCGMAGTATRLALADPPEPATVGGYLLEWLSHVRGRVRRVTYDGYECLLRCHALPVLAGVALDELTPLRLQQLYANLLAGGEGQAALSGGTRRSCRNGSATPRSGSPWTPIATCCPRCSRRLRKRSIPCSPARPRCPKRRSRPAVGLLRDRGGCSATAFWHWV